jgi:hypothetical protein
LDELERTLVALRPRLQPSSVATERVLEAVLQVHAQNVGRSGSRRSVRLVIALAVIALLAAPAYALVTHVIDFSHSTKAPTIIQKRFQVLFKSGAPPGMDPRVIADETRRVTVFHPSSGRVPLWVAPTQTGGFCSEFVDVDGGCIADRAFIGVRPTLDGFKPWLLAPSLSYVGRAGGGASYITGVVLPKEASRLELSLADGSVQPVTFVWVSSPIDAGFYLVELPSTASYPATLSLFDREGNLLSRSESLSPPPGPRSLQ